jgi:hypothetical protein
MSLFLSMSLLKVVAIGSGFLIGGVTILGFIFVQELELILSAIDEGEFPDTIESDMAKIVYFSSVDYSESYLQTLSSLHSS